MRKTIFSAALKTFAATLSLIILLLSLVTLFMPLRLAKFCKNSGAYNLAASFTVIEYNRSKQINHLSQIVELSSISKNYSKVIKYGALLTTHSDFSKLCALKDQNTNEYILASYQQYIYGRYAAALYYKNQADKAQEIAKSVTKGEFDRVTYEKNNAMSYLVDAIIQKNDAENGRDVLNHLQSLYSEIEGKIYDDDEQRDEAQAAQDNLFVDIERLLELIG